MMCACVYGNFRVYMCVGSYLSGIVCGCDVRLTRMRVTLKSKLVVVTAVTRLGKRGGGFWDEEREAGASLNSDSLGKQVLGWFTACSLLSSVVSFLDVDAIAFYDSTSFSGLMDIRSQPRGTETIHSSE